MLGRTRAGLKLMSQPYSCLQVLVWVQSRADAHEPGSLPAPLIHGHTQCLPSPDKYKLEVLIEQKHTEDVQWRRQVPVWAEADLRHAHPEDGGAFSAALL